MQLLAGRSELRLGDADPIRDMNFVANTVEGYLRLAECDAAIGHMVNVGSGRGLKIREFAELAMRIVGRKVPIVTESRRVRPGKSEVRTLICDYQKANRLMGWSPRISLEAGLEATAKFMKDHLDLYRPDEYAV
jgi:dTDP-glucose 4,6-dehydratase